ncbi:MAG: oligoribonuclease [Actinomycetota bacterium]|nr:oligoribonuclease [Actinomycetota bacterium]
MIDRLVWIDCEMTGLELERDALVEVAVLITDSELNILDPGIDLVLSAPADTLESMKEVVRDMHTSSGLLDAIRESSLGLADAQEQVLAYIKQFVPERRKAPLCGNSIATDRGFLARDMPVLDDWLHYRMIDVSSIKELAKRWYPRVYYSAPAKAGGHRALADITESIEELRYYRATIFVEQPGPDIAAARAAAGRAPAAPPEAVVPD